MPYERKTSDIFISDQLKDILETIKDKSVVAQMLIQKRLPKEYVQEGHINYICVSKTDPTKISYLTPDKIELISQSSTEDFWTTTKRIAGKPGSSISKILKDISPMEVEKFSNMYRAFSLKEDNKFQIVSGQDIKKYYHQDTYLSQSGTLGTSCMKYNQCMSFFDIYINNQDIISMLLLMSPDNKVIGRAILWNQGDTKIMDRVYTTKDDVYLHHFTKWASDNGYFHKTHQNWQKTVSFTDGVNDDEKKIDVQLNHWNFDNYPYLDTFKWLDTNTGIISNYQPEHFKTRSRNLRVLLMANGGYENSDYLAFCDVDRQFYYRGDTVAISDTMRVCTHHCEYSETLDTYILKSEAVYSREIEDYIYSDNSRNDVDKIAKRVEFLNRTRKRNSSFIDGFNNFYFTVAAQ